MNDYSGECFALLGSGAGRTSIFKMLTGDKTISSGGIFVQGMNLKTDQKKINKIIGYCPQFDALIEDLTGSETIEIFALLRGVRPNDIPELCKRFTSQLNFQDHINKNVREFSGGEKRKLSIALALIGNPAVILLGKCFL